MKIVATFMILALPLLGGPELTFTGIGPVRLAQRLPPDISALADGGSAKQYEVTGYTLKRQAPFAKFGDYDCTVLVWERDGVVFSIKWVVEVEDAESAGFRRAFREVTGVDLPSRGSAIEGNRLLSVFGNGKRVEVTLHMFKNESGA